MALTLILISTLDGVGGQRHAPAVLSPIRNQYPLYSRLGGPQDRSGRVQKISFPLKFDPRTVRPAHTEWLYRLRYPGSHFKDVGMYEDFFLVILSKLEVSPTAFN
jgi:hypothetical protein